MLLQPRRKINIQNYKLNYQITQQQNGKQHDSYTNEKGLQQHLGSVDWCLWAPPHSLGGSFDPKLSLSLSLSLCNMCGLIKPWISSGNREYYNKEIKILKGDVKYLKILTS
jgi:hypothetical protein